MGERIDRQTFEDVVGFHGHVCPGLATGVRVAQAALRELGERAEDEELVAVAETDNCAVDAIQYLTGCTYGKGNLIHLEYGRNAFIFARRSDGKAIRISVKALPPAEGDGGGDQAALIARVFAREASDEDQRLFNELWHRRAMRVLAAPEADLLDIEELVDYELPARAQVYESIRCDGCGERVMAPRLRDYRGKRLCPPCYEAAMAKSVIVPRIGMVHNELVPGQAKSRARSERSRIVIEPAYREGLLGIEVGQRVQILFQFDKAPNNFVLQQHPMGRRDLAARGVFALRSPHRPSGLGLTTVRVLEVDDEGITVAGLDAWDGSPVVDIKPYVASLDKGPQS